MFRRRNQQPQYSGDGYNQPRRRRSIKGTLIIGLVIAAFYLIKFYSTSQVNPITGEKQYISLTAEQEVAIGIQSAPSMAQQHGGLHPDQRAQDMVDAVGERLVRNTIAKRSDYHFEFHLLRDDQVVNAFALPGGQVFITAALFERLENEDQLAGVLGHEIGHVIHRHGAERIEKQKLTEGLTGAAVIAAGDYSSGQMAQMASNIWNMKHGRDQELESDDFGVRLMIESGYQPTALIGVMDILEAASGTNSQPEFMSSHPSPDNRREEIQASIDKYYGG